MTFKVGKSQLFESFCNIAKLDLRYLMGFGDQFCMNADMTSH